MTAILETKRDHRQKACILEIQRLSTEDGPGIRTTVFFKGCSLACRWCHNPESISAHPQIHWIETRCMGCGMCVEACPNGALRMGDQGIEILRTVCRGCGLCAEACPTASMELLGQSWTLEGLLAEVLKDRAYYADGGGGITVSGGEPILQGGFLAPFLARLTQAGVHTAIDTCGMYEADRLLTLLPVTNLVLYDLKEIDEQRHRRFNGQGNRRILENLRLVAEHLSRQVPRPQLWIRTPVIPDTTDREENIAGIGAFLAKHVKGRVARWELCAFNDLCKDKYRRLDMAWPYAQAALLSDQHMQTLAAVARDSGVDPQIVHISGSTRKQVSNDRSATIEMINARQVAHGP